MSQFRKYFQFLKKAVKGEHIDATTGDINKVIVLLAIPMILEMFMESLFAIADIFFVSKVSIQAVAVVGLTESTLTIVYSLGFGLSMGATALVARRMGEKDQQAATETAVQALYIAAIVSACISLVGIFFSENILSMLGAKPELVEYGAGFTRWMYTGNFVIMFLFMINGIFRGAGDAGIAMRSLWIANLINIALDPLFIFGIGFFPELGLKGAAVATTIGRGCGVLYQLYYLTNGKSAIRLKGAIWKFRKDVAAKLVSISSGATGQFIIASSSWIFLMSIISRYGEEALSGYTLGIRVLIFILLPAWGFSNAAATFTGQNLGAKLPERAETGVWRTGRINMAYMGFVTLLFLFIPDHLLRLFTTDKAVIDQGVLCLRIMSLGFIFYGYEMVMSNAFNGAGDSRTPTIINIFGFWLLQIPLAYGLAIALGLGSTGVFIAVPVSESAMAVAFILLFRKGRWKKVVI